MLTDTIKKEESDQFKALYVMMLRATQIAFSTSFFQNALIEELDRKGLIDKTKVEIDAQALGYNVMKDVNEMADKMETDLFGEPITSMDKETKVAD
jgi:hypothetical protein